MKRLFAAVAITAVALTSIAPMVQAAEPAAKVYQVAAKKKATKSVKKKASAKTSQATVAAHQA
jgi:hypothetical protein